MNMDETFAHKKVYYNLRSIALELSTEFKACTVNRDETVSSFLIYINYQEHRNIKQYREII
jgi:hypothetical protein